MFHACAAKFDVMKNLEKRFSILVGTKQGLRT